MVKTGSSLSLAQIQFNFIPGQRAKLQLVGQGIQRSECESRENENKNRLL